MVSDEKMLSFELVFLYSLCVISLWLFLGFFSVFSFQKIKYNVSWYGFLQFYPVWGSLRFLNYSFYVFNQIWGAFSHYFFEYFSSPTLFSRILMVWIFPLFYCPRDLWGSVRTGISWLFFSFKCGFLGSWYDEWFFLCPGQFGYYIRRLFPFKCHLLRKCE